MTSNLSSFKELDPELILNATESAGFRTTGELSQLNSYENRVFEVGIEVENETDKGNDTQLRNKAAKEFQLEEHDDSSGADPSDSEPFDKLIIKFYRPGRWSAKCILEEHSFLNELADNDILVAPALDLDIPGSPGPSLGEIEGLYFALFPKVRGRLPDEFDETKLKRLGRILARLHNFGAQKKFHHRPILNEKPFSLWENLELLEKNVAVELWPRYEKAAIEIIDAYESVIDPSSFQRIHGDFHRGNTLLDGEQFLLVDFDDCCTGPAVQDFWMLFSSGDEESLRTEAQFLIDGYEEFRKFPKHQLDWIPALRGARILSYAAWIARRWSDPSFSRLFPDFGSHKYWSVETEALERIVYNSLLF